MCSEGEPMTGQTENTTDRKDSRTNKFLVWLILVVILSLITWSFFYVKEMPLGSAETSVVVGFWLVVVFGIRWTIGMIGKHKRRTTSPKGAEIASHRRKTE
jgi:drug/metabolite transporter (DMT)-like permease